MEVTIAKMLERSAWQLIHSELVHVAAVKRLDEVRLECLDEMRDSLASQEELTLVDFLYYTNTLRAVVSDLNTFEVRLGFAPGQVLDWCRNPELNAMAMSGTGRKWIVHAMLMELSYDLEYLIPEPRQKKKRCKTAGFESVKERTRKKPLVSVTEGAPNRVEVLEVVLPKGMGSDVKLSSLSQGYEQLSARVRHAFVRHDISTIGQLLRVGADSPTLSLLYRLEQNLKPNFGRFAAKEVIAWLVAHGIQGRL